MYVHGMNVPGKSMTGAGGGIAMPATQHLQGSLYGLVQPQLTSYCSALEMTGKSSCHHLDTSCQPQCDGSRIAARGMSALPQTCPPWYEARRT